MSEEETIHWTKLVGEALIDAVSFSIGGVEVATSAPGHRGSDKESCPWCKGKPKLELSRWGNLHVYEEAERKWIAYENGNVINEMSMDFIELFEELSDTK